MISLGMDGPRRYEDIGIWTFCIACGALWFVVKKSTWILKKVLQSVMELVHDSPARKNFLHA